MNNQGDEMSFNSVLETLCRARYLIDIAVKALGGRVPPNGHTMAGSRPIPKQAFVGMKLADAIEKLLRWRGQPMQRKEILKELRSHGCKLATNPRYDFRAVAIAIGANKRKFYEEGEMVGMTDWKPELDEGLASNTPRRSSPRLHLQGSKNVQ